MCFILPLKQQRVFWQSKRKNVNDNKTFWKVEKNFLLGKIGFKEQNWLAEKNETILKVGDAIQIFFFEHCN